MRRLLRPLFLLSLLVSWAFGPVLQTESADSPIKLPAAIALNVDEGIPSVQLMINGQGPFVFGIDTGAQGGSRIDASLVEKLGLKSSGQVQATDGSGRSPQTSEIFKLENVTIGNVQFSNVTAGSRNFKNSPRPLKVDGILGLSVFSEYLVTLDFPAKVLRFDRGELPKSDGAEVLDYKGEGAIPLVELSVGSARINAHLDSGNMIGEFVFPTSFADK
ncbi:MAG: retropepsin-like domain-containing protein, partial [Verrucomicrobiota bacterium]|nr:retropepsin-like domain-containing protein [Verrucomicrobiota bacterium]